MRGPVCCGWDPGLFGGCGFPIPKDCECVPFHGKRDFADVNKLRMLRWGDDSALFVWARCDHKGPYNSEAAREGLAEGDGAMEAKRQSLEEPLVLLLPLKLEEGARSAVAFRS